MAIWVGIDVSKDTLDFGFIVDGQKFHRKVPNTRKGFAEILKEVPATAHFVMEATGTYYLNLALYLHEQGLYVAVVNPFRIKSHMKSDMRRTKTDKADAYSIAQFGKEKEPSAWVPVKSETFQIQQLQGVYDRFTHQITQLKNEIHAFKRAEISSKLAMRECLTAIKDLRKRRAVVMAEMERLAESVLAREIELLESIEGIGRRTAIRIASAIGDFRRFETSRKLVSFAGLSPMTEQSGTSIHSKGRISRMGGTRIRGALYMCAIVAKTYNPQCKAMWDRLKAEKKHGKVIIVAIMCKLLRQMHALVTKNVAYDPNFFAKAA